MVVVFYCYGVRVEQDDAPFPDLWGPMYFPVPPQIGQVVKSRSTGMFAEISQIDHYRMVIDVMPIQVVEVVG